jgi:hypothetical protein
MPSPNSLCEGLPALFLLNACIELKYPLCITMEKELFDLFVQF